MQVYILSEREWDEGIYLLVVDEEAIERRRAMVAEFKDKAEGYPLRLDELVFNDPQDIYVADPSYASLDAHGFWSIEFVQEIMDARTLPLDKLPSWCHKKARIDSCKLLVGERRFVWSVTLRGEDRPRITDSI